MIGITILGATGTIGLNTLDVLAQHPGRFRVVALTAHRNVELLYQQCVQWRPSYAVLVDDTAAEQLATRLRPVVPEITVLSGVAGLETVARLPEVQMVMAAIVGAAGLLPTLAAAEAGKRVLLANKEALVMSGPLFMAAVERQQAELLPIDSEHNAVFQCLPHSPSTRPADLARQGISRIILTASGGPFRQWSLDRLAQVTPDQACAHPNWKMGRKISVDSATMMNKGLEVIEACWLFSASPQHVDVVLHPQSVIHSLVEYVDGSVLAQLGNPDMRTPIAYALAWPERMSAGVSALDLIKVARLEFEAADWGRFPCLRLAYEAMAAGGTTTAILNAANEVAVAEFLAGRLPFTAIPLLIEATLSQVSGRVVDHLDTILADDAKARAFATEWMANY
ncbi:1-deoxy-D-xylulose-5-phosphate reductoisomerase [Thioflexithrix psekupsensis]|uniref:1-deoxy-D-xylulose 5-phosphate reductoisomerase n=1 Tax=Thioflexithrix psekupsensis TaxID=1570016 RepID=A0A251XCT9_9GAMM|nr:1-deoxy-D-xylulose-5-phosphate reductoisomerase [Thioflexithrix psekupsensis]OUD15735.1 1-deoxy-D-xylulose-5-phosphate reductoisomerase [Thioflexithrix psekupsensis]